MFESHDEIYKSTDKPAPRTAFVFVLILVFLAGGTCSLAIRTAFQQGRLSSAQLFWIGWNVLLVAVLLAKVLPIVYRALPPKTSRSQN